MSRAGVLRPRASTGSSPRDARPQRPKRPATSQVRPLTEFGKQAVRRAIDARYAGYPTLAPGDLMGAKIDAVATELMA
jgi:hypothetical protein